MRVADFIALRLIELGVRHVFGVGGANIEDVFSAVQRRRPQIRAVLCAHEHAAGTAADAYVRIAGLGAEVLPHAPDRASPVADGEQLRRPRVLVEPSFTGLRGAGRLITRIDK
jgi:acetolactate synthase I/II/III large subunit